MTGVLRTLRRRLRGVSRLGASTPFGLGTRQSKSAAVLLHIPTSDGSGQACHPSVLHVPQAIGAYCYWMANTPYPGDAHKLENPEVFASHDGLFWEVPPGLRNPVVLPPPGDDRHYHSDPCLLSHLGRLLLYFRTSDEESRPRRDWLSMMVSDDGRDWSTPRTVLEAEGGALLLSPSVRVIAGEFFLWTVEAQSPTGGLAVVRRTGADGLTWSDPQRTTLNWPGTAFEPWHIEVCEAGDQLTMIFSARRPGRPGTQRWFSATGDGLHWQVEDDGSAERCGFEGGKPYKPSWLPPSPERPAGWLYTSSAGSDGCWYTAVRPGLFTP